MDARRPPRIGLYFARLWYFEALYPLIFAASAMKAAGEAKSGEIG